jgi:hypothetical protein
MQQVEKLQVGRFKPATFQPVNLQLLLNLPRWFDLLFA